MFDGRQLSPASPDYQITINGTSRLNKLIESIAMWRRLGRMQSPRPGRRALLAAWLTMLDRAQRRDAAPALVRIGSLTFHGYNWPDLLDVFREVWISQAYHCAFDTDEPFIIDCGANVGAASLYFKMYQPRCRLLAFEPNPSCATVWRKNMAANGHHEAQLVEAACGRTEGQAELHVADGGTLGSNVGDLWHDKADRRTVQLVRLSRWIDRQVDLLKIDVEGAEHDILDELVESGAIARVRRIALEYHHQLPGQGRRLGGFLQILEDAGFTYRLDAQVEPRSMYDIGFQGLMIYATR